MTLKSYKFHRIQFRRINPRNSTTVIIFISRLTAIRWSYMPRGVTITMINNCKTISVLAIMLTLTVGIAFATTSLQQQVLAQNMTTGNNATEGGNMTGELNQTGSIAGVIVQ